MKNFASFSRVLNCLIAAALLCSPAAWAQQTSRPLNNPAEPIQPVAPLQQATGDNPATQDTSQNGELQDSVGVTRPNSRLLSSAEVLGLDSVHRFAHMFDPAVQVSESGESGVAPGHTLSVSTLGGSLDLREGGRRYELTVTYRGGDTIYRPASYYGVPDTPYHAGGLSQEVFFGRWTLIFRDDAMYSRGSGFGALFAGGPAVVGQGSALGSLQPSLASGSTIQTALARQLSNTALSEVDYARSRRTTFSLVGSYGLLHFLDPGYINSHTVTGRLGYNHTLSAKNNIAVTYDHSRVNFSGATGHLQTDALQLSFGRQITGRLALQLTGGPQLLHVAYFNTPNPQTLSWTGTVSLKYGNARNSYSLAYYRGVSAGSGVFFGSKIQTVSAGVSRSLTKSLSASVNGGYAINDALAPALIYINQFSDWFAGATLSRPLGRQFRMSLNYGFQQQTNGIGACPVASCGLGHSFMQYGATLEWHPLQVRAR